MKRSITVWVIPKLVHWCSEGTSQDVSWIHPVVETISFAVHGIIRHNSYTSFLLVVLVFLVVPVKLKE